LELHRGERGERPAQPRAEQRPLIRGQRQPLLQPGGEVAEQERAGQVYDEGGPRPAARMRGQPLQKPRPRKRSQGAASEDRRKFTNVVSGHLLALSGRLPDLRNALGQVSQSCYKVHERVPCVARWEPPSAVSPAAAGSPSMKR